MPAGAARACSLPPPELSGMFLFSLSSEHPHSAPQTAMTPFLLVTKEDAGGGRGGGEQSAQGRLLHVLLSPLAGREASRLTRNTQAHVLESEQPGLHPHGVARMRKGEARSLTSGQETRCLQAAAGRPLQGGRRAEGLLPPHRAEGWGSGQGSSGPPSPTRMALHPPISGEMGTGEAAALCTQPFPERSRRPTGPERELVLRAFPETLDSRLPFLQRAPCRAKPYSKATSLSLLVADFSSEEPRKLAT